MEAVEPRSGDNTERGGPAVRSVGELTKELLQETGALARAEAALIKSELSEKISEAERGIGALITGGAILCAGMLALVAAAVIALDRMIELWLAAVIVGVAVTALGAAMFSAGKAKVSSKNLTPHRTIEEVSRTRSYIEEEIR
jgi:VIT1/CCC1 family predicted Fe2+/Mn2+ transporter